MQAQLEQVEVQTGLRHDDDFAVDHAPVRQCLRKHVVELGKVAIERPRVAALDVDLARLPAKDDGAETVPFGLVEERAACRQRLRQLREHRFDRRFDWKGHELVYWTPIYLEVTCIRFSVG